MTVDIEKLQATLRAERRWGFATVTMAFLAGMVLSAAILHFFR